MKKVLVWGLIAAVVLILIRVIWKTPFVNSVVEHFASSNKALINPVTECPANTQMYMYAGAAYCCGGRVNADADRVADSCRPIAVGKKPTFCTLGPSTGGVKNCLELKGGLLQAEGETICPPSMPNFTKGSGSQGRCCAGSINDTMDDCTDLGNGKYCDVSGDDNEFLNPLGCRFLREKEKDTGCPPEFKQFQGFGAGPLDKLTLYGCKDNSKMCYSKALVGRLKELGYDPKDLPVCGVVGPLPLPPA